MSRGALQKMLRRSRHEKRTKQIVCIRSKNGPKIYSHVSNLKFFDFVFEGFRSTLKRKEGKFDEISGPGIRTQNSVVTSGTTISHATEAVSDLEQIPHQSQLGYKPKPVH